MSDRPEITLQQIRARASEQSFSRGENYYNTGAVSDTIRCGDEIEARCHGSYPEPYRVWAKLDASGIAATRCNCEYDWAATASTSSQCCSPICTSLTSSRHVSHLDGHRVPCTDAHRLAAGGVTIAPTLLREISQAEVIDLQFILRV